MDRLRNLGSSVRSRLSWKMIFIFATIILLIIAIMYVYNRYMTPQLETDYSPNKEFIDEVEPDKNVELIMFTVDWCPHCKKAAPVWKKFTEEYQDKTINGYQVEFRTVNCTDEKDAEVKEMLDKYKIEGYPTILMIKDGTTINFDAKPEHETLEKFLQKVLSN
jgi:thiol-disulfide isomerase/thioredoxin